MIARVQRIVDGLLVEVVPVLFRRDDQDLTVDHYALKSLFVQLLLNSVVPSVEVPGVCAGYRLLPSQQSLYLVLHPAVVIVVHPGAQVQVLGVVDAGPLLQRGGGVEPEYLSAVELALKHRLDLGPGIVGPVEAQRLQRALVLQADDVFVSLQHFERFCYGIVGAAEVTPDGRQQEFVIDCLDGVLVEAGQCP